MRLHVYALCFLVVVSLPLCIPFFEKAISSRQFIRSPLSPFQTGALCLLGRAESKGHAESFMKKFSNSFGIFAISRQEECSSRPIFARGFAGILCTNSSSWGSSILSSLDLLEASELLQLCEYILFLNDSVNFTTPAANGKEFNVEGSLLDLVGKFRPAVATFTTLDSNSGIHHWTHRSARLPPRDARTILLHASLLNLLGTRSGTVSGDSLDTLLRIVPSVFENDTVPVETVVSSYPHNIGLSVDSSNAEGSKTLSLSKDGIRALPRIRLSKSGGDRDYGNLTNFILRANERIDILAEPFRSLPVITQSGVNLREIRSTHFAPVVKLIIFSESPSSNLADIVESLRISSDSDACTCLMDLTIYVDCESVDPRKHSGVKAVRWRKGSFAVKCFNPHRRAQDIVNAWNPQTLDEIAVISDATRIPSVHFCDIVLSAVQRYYYGTNETLANSSVFGVSLSSNRVTGQEKLRDPPNEGPFLYQRLAADGQVVFPMLWTEFQKSFRRSRDLDPLIPDAPSLNQLPRTASWVKHATRWCWEERHFSVHLPLPLSPFNDAVSPLTTQRQVLVSLPNLEQLVKYNVHGELVRSASSPQDLLQRFKKFTIVIPSWSPRKEFLHRAVRHYSSLTDIVDQILIIWNDPDHKPPEFQDNGTGVLVTVLRMNENNILNRFTPWPEIRTMGILSLDDDVYIFAPDVAFMFYIWQLHSTQIVGALGTTRSHMDPSSEKPLYYNVPPANISTAGLKGYSVVLTGAAFLHSKYLSHLFSNRSEFVTNFHAAVSEQSNCEDLLLNFMVASESQLPHVVVDARMDLPTMSSSPKGLWTRADHFSERSNCIHRLLEGFGRSTLKNVIPYNYQKKESLRRQWTLQKQTIVL